MIARAVSHLERGGPGKPLESTPRATLEPVLQRDLGDVRIHRAALGPLKVQAATRGSDIYFEAGQDDDFETAESMTLLGHELTHVSQQSGLAQTKAARAPAFLPAVQREVLSDEAEAETTERTIMRSIQSASSPLTAKARLAKLPTARVQRAPEEAGSGIPMPDLAMPDMDLAGGEDIGSDEEGSTDFEALRTTVDEIIGERVQELLGALGIEAGEGEGGEAETAAAEAETKSEADLDDLAKKVLPYIKRLIAVERERRVGWQ